MQRCVDLHCLLWVHWCEVVEFVAPNNHKKKIQSSETFRYYLVLDGKHNQQRSRSDQSSQFIYQHLNDSITVSSEPTRNQFLFSRGKYQQMDAWARGAGETVHQPSHTGYRKLYWGSSKRRSSTYPHFQVNAWDNILLKNGEKILELNKAVEKVKADQTTMEQELEYISVSYLIKYTSTGCICIHRHNTRS